MARIDLYRVRRLDSLAAANSDLEKLFKSFRQPAALVLQEYAAAARAERQRRKALRKKLVSVFARMVKRYAKAMKVQEKREAAYNDAIRGDEKLEELSRYRGPRDLGPELREVLALLDGETLPSREEFVGALRTAIEVPDEVTDYGGELANVRKRLVRRKGAKK